METENIIKYGSIALAVILCIGIKFYFGANPIVNDVDQAIESVVKTETSYDITPIVDAV
jgi:hypothetical protein